MIFLSLNEAYLAWYVWKIVLKFYLPQYKLHVLTLPFTNILVSSANRISSFELHTEWFLYLVPSYMGIHSIERCEIALNANLFTS